MFPSTIFSYSTTTQRETDVEQLKIIAQFVIEVLKLKLPARVKTVLCARLLTNGIGYKEEEEERDACAQVKVAKTGQWTNIINKFW